MKNAKINAPKVFVGDASKNKLAAYHLIIYQVSLYREILSGSNLPPKKIRLLEACTRRYY